jgi:nucleoside-diphosphate-sugar epimerase
MSKSQSSVHTVLVTGADGHIGRIFREHYGATYHLRLTDRRVSAPAGADMVVADLTDYGAMLAMVRGVDAVVHLAAATGIFEPWSSVLPNNIEATYNVFEAAREVGVPKVVFASSHHACGFALGDEGTCGPDAPARPDGLYGVSKVFGEALGRLYADRHGLSVICLRIGWCHGGDDPASRRAMVRQMQRKHPKLPYGAREQVGLWISNPDMAQLIHCSLQANVDYGVYYAASDNKPAILDITRAREDLGYAPEDSVNDYLPAEYG